ncbi:hypothetical protein AC249_AIPGENE11021 [Exaiptasia diaphana]|nr:hypothetical protein AC249_AIPGENE11021 [Exaiptasia diaphana]
MVLKTKVKQEYDLVDEEFKEDKTPSENAKALKMKLREKIFESRKERWEAKPLHGQNCINVNKSYVDQAATNAWLTLVDLKGETEGFIAAAQDQSLLAQNYQHHVLKDNTTDGLCRLCHSKTESIDDHLLTGCEILAPTQYLKRPNNAASIILALDTV